MDECELVSQSLDQNLFRVELVKDIVEACVEILYRNTGRRNHWNRWEKKRNSLVVVHFSNEMMSMV